MLASLACLCGGRDRPASVSTDCQEWEAIFELTFWGPVTGLLTQPDQYPNDFSAWTMRMKCP